MTAIAGLFVSARHRQLVIAAIWLASAVVTLSVIAIVLTYLATVDLHSVNKRLLADHTRFARASFELIDLLEKQVVSDACSEPFLEGMRKIAFLPDGINSILYQEGGVVVCSATAGRLAVPVDIGQPDLRADETALKFDIWFDRSQGTLGLPGETGSIVGRNGFLVIVPHLKQEEAETAISPDDFEVVMRPRGDLLVHRMGAEGLYSSTEGTGIGFIWSSPAFHASNCDSFGLFCAVSRVTLVDIAVAHLWELVSLVLLGALAGSFVTRMASNAIASYWSFEARFLRTLNADTVECVYQPIISVESQKTVGLEVLARWRDVDGRQVFPDQFLPIVYSRGLSARLTEIIISKARAELRRHLSVSCELQIAFNISPRDYSFAFLYPLLEESAAATGGPRLSYAVEIVEAESFDHALIKREMTLLRSHGIRTFIDDFGVGFSNIGTLAELPIDGVKLDRCFAMASDGSLWANMLPRALELIGSAGHKVVVEGVETRQRLDALAENPHVAFAQGYYIARPMAAEALPEFLGEGCQRLFSYKPNGERSAPRDKVVPLELVSRS